MSRLVKVASSLQTKLIVSFVLLIVAIAGGTYLYTFDQTKRALLEGARDDLAQIIGIASTQFSPAEIAQIQAFKEGDDETAEFRAIVEKLRAMRAMSPNVANFYIVRVSEDKVVFVVDDAEEEPAWVGREYEQPEDALFEANDGVRVSPDLYTDEYGTFLSGYAPIVGTSGESTLVIGADIEAKTIVDRENFIGNTIYLVMGLAIFLAAVIIGLFSLTIIRDIKRLNKVAQEISTGDTNVTVNVHRRDEIGDLARSFSRMVASLKIMMGVGEEPEPEKSEPKGR